MRRSPLPVFLLAASALLMASCRGVDYDIAEVASPDYTGLEDDHDDGHGDQDHDVLEGPGSEEEAAGDLHLHETGVRNHGTVWFFNQPWAASFIWVKIVRDSVVLLALACVVQVVSRPRRLRRHDP